MNIALIATRSEIKIDRCRFLKEDLISNPVNNKRQPIKVYIIILPNVPKANAELCTLYIPRSSALNHHMILSSHCFTGFQPYGTGGSDSGEGPYKTGSPDSERRR